MQDSLITTFATMSEAEKAVQRLDERGIDYEVIRAEPGFNSVGTIGVVTDAGGRAALGEDGAIADSGWVDYRPACYPVPMTPPETFSEDAFGAASIMLLGPCVADITKIRLIAHLSGDLNPVLPYLNATLPAAFYNPEGQSLTLMDRYRMIVLYPNRMTIAKADDLVDAWRTLEELRLKVNRAWMHRAEIEPSYEMRRKPPALEIYKRLPGTNCGICGEKTCMAFALRLWNGEATPSLCAPVFTGDQGHLREALLEICMGLGAATEGTSAVGLKD